MIVKTISRKSMFVRESEGGGDGIIEPELSKLELDAKVREEVSIMS